MNIVVYTKANCVNCRVAKDILKSKGLEYNAINLETDAERELFFINHPMARQFPYILINNQRVGGLAGLQVALTQIENKNAPTTI